MENLKNKNINELLQNIDKIIDFLYTHNKNYTKQQYYSIIDLVDIIEELKGRYKSSSTKSI